MDWLTPILSKLNEVTIFFILCLGGLGYLYLTERKENRADRQALIDLLHKNTEAITQLRIAMAAITGKSA
jgi:hypothetical protein